MSTLLALLVDVPPPVWPETVAPDPGPNSSPGAFLYEPGTVHHFDLTLSEEAMDALGRDEPDVRATLTYEGVTWEVGLKLKGSSTYQNLGGKPSFKLDLEQWVEDQALLGVRRLTLNSMIFDASMLREHMVYALYAAAGAPSPRHGYAWVTLNGEDYGLYGIVETMDEQWLRRVFPGQSEGNLYDSTFTFADLTGAGVSAFVLKEGEPLEPYADLHALVSDLDRKGVRTVLDERFDRDPVLAMWAVDLATANWDGYSRNTNNYLLYHALPADRWYFVPWGQDTSFRGGGSLYLGVVGRMVVGCRSDGACADALEAKVREVLDVWEALDLSAYARETWGVIGPYCEEDPRRDAECDGEGLVRTMEERLSALRRELGG